MQQGPSPPAIPSLYWIPKLHKCSYKQYYIAGSVKCSTKRFPNYQHLFFQRSILGFRVTVTLATRGVVWIGCGIWKTLKIF